MSEFRRYQGHPVWLFNPTTGQLGFHNTITHQDVGLSDSSGNGAGSAGAAGQAARLSVALFGDSNTANSFATATAISQAAYAKGSAGTYEKASFQRLKIAYSGAVVGAGVFANGTVPVQKLSKQIDDAMASSAWANVRVCIIWIGTNDGSNSPDAVIAELQPQVKRITDTGRIALIKKILPCISPAVNGGTYDPNTPRWAWGVAYNSKLESMCARLGTGVILSDSWGRTVDPTANPPSGKASLFRSDDGTGLHTSNNGGILDAQGLVADLDYLLPSEVDWITNNYANASTPSGSALSKPYNALTNPLCLDVTANVANGLTTSVSSGNVVLTPSVVPSPTGYGNVQRLGMTSTANNDFGRLVSSSGHANITNGSTVFAQAFIKLGTPANVRTVRFALFVTVAGQVYSNTDWETEAALDVALNRGFEFLFRTPEFVVPATGSITSAQWQMTVFFTGGGSCTVELGQHELRVIPPN